MLCDCNICFFTLCGDIHNIAKCAAAKTIAGEMHTILSHMKTVCMETRARRGKSVQYSADMVLLDFPTGFIPDGFAGMVHVWNILDDRLMEASMQFASTIFDDDGLVVSILGVPEVPTFVRVAKKSRLKVIHHAILRGVDKFGITAMGFQVNFTSTYFPSMLLFLFCSRFMSSNLHTIFPQVHMLVVYVTCRIDSAPSIPMVIATRLILPFSIVRLTIGYITIL
ncbi:hypothetical protein O6H91_07G131500 [Diphasiastrum complanatum]|uniref:Uncharacterized protein n=1 Tax=Diphasiastrum complanatum TaxID=34168 RepID=A0ACC2DA04_DIPCM|nr:hypothetical protein O6H91_07G131500 [Diphasiastrum complanatum]